ncbi:hypothetical protein [Candidatus Nitrosocosmicus sp. R]
MERISLPIIIYSSRALVYSNENYTIPFDGSTIGPGHVNLRLDLDSIHYPSNYGLSFYTAESFQSNAVRDFIKWIAVPPSTINILINPKDLVIRQGDEDLVPSEFETPLSDNVTSIIFDDGPSYNFDGLNVSTERVHPPLFRVKASPQTPVGVYDIPILASMLNKPHHQNCLCLMIQLLELEIQSFIYLRNILQLDI